jgi:hypothetical protein
MRSRSYALALITLTACAAPSAARQPTNNAVTRPAAASPSSAVGVIAGTVRGYGGPLKPDGHMALDGQPFGSTKVTIADGHGTVAVSVTGADGVFTFDVRAGKYLLSSSCNEPAVIVVQPGRTVRRDLRCDVP